VHIRLPHFDDWRGGGLYITFLRDPLKFAGRYGNGCYGVFLKIRNFLPGGGVDPLGPPADALCVGAGWQLYARGLRGEHGRALRESE
jgi:hypothetical protein